MRDWMTPNPHRYGRAIFLDRDGTINEDVHYPHQISDLTLIPGSLDGIRRLSELPCQIIVVSNQAGIAKGLFSVAEMAHFNQQLRSRIERAGGRIDAFYYCPHAEAKDLPAGSPVCQCSKPNPGMLWEAEADFGLNLAESFLVGDKRSDVAAGQRAGVTSLLVETGYAGTDGCHTDHPPAATVPDLRQAAVWIHRRMTTSRNPSKAAASR